MFIFFCFCRHFFFLSLIHTAHIIITLDVRVMNIDFCFVSHVKIIHEKRAHFYDIIFLLSLVEPTVRRHWFGYFVCMCEIFLRLLSVIWIIIAYLLIMLFIYHQIERKPSVFLWRLTLCVLKLDACWHCFTYRKIVAKLAHTHLVYHISKLICFCLSWLEIDFAVPFVHPLKSLTPNKAYTTCQF